MTDSPWLTRDQVAERLQVKPATVKYWAAMGRGPRYARFGIHARYHIDDVIAWEREQFDDEAAS